MTHIITEGGRKVRSLKLVVKNGVEQVRDTSYADDGYPVDVRTYPLDSDEGMLRLADAQVPVDLIRGQR